MIVIDYNDLAKRVREVLGDIDVDDVEQVRNSITDVERKCIANVCVYVGEYAAFIYMGHLCIIKIVLVDETVAEFAGKSDKNEYVASVVAECEIQTKDDVVKLVYPFPV